MYNQTVVVSNTEYTSDSNMIPYDQYVKDNAEPVVQNNASSVSNDASMIIINEMPKLTPRCDSVKEHTKVVDASLTAELVIYKEQVELYERWAKFELTVREQKIDEQLRIVITDRNIKEKNLKKKLHSVKMQLQSTINHNKSMVKEVKSLKKDFKQKENKYLEEFLDIKSLKEKVEDKLFKQDQSLQTVHMLCKPKPYYDEQRNVAIGYKSPLCLARAKQVLPALYNGHEIIKSQHVPTIVHNLEDTLEIVEITRKKMNEKMKTPLWSHNKINIRPPDYSKENFLAKAAKPVRALTVYPPNTPVKLVPKVLPIKIQVKFNIFALIQLFLEFEKTCKTRITPTGLTEGKRGFEQTKECYLTEVIPVFKTLKEHFKGIQKALTKEIKEMKAIFNKLEAEVDQNAVNRKCDEIERNFFIITNDTLIANCLSKEVFYIATNSELNVSRFSKMHDVHTVVQARCLELKTELSKLKDKIQKDDHDVMVKSISNLEETRSDTDRTLDFRALDFQITQLTKKPQFSKNKMSFLGSRMQKLNSITRNCMTLSTSNNREVHLEYLEHLKESVATIREIVEEVRVERPLDSSLASACLYTKRSQELVEYTVVQIVLWYLDSGCSKHMTGDRSRLLFTSVQASLFNDKMKSVHISLGLALHRKMASGLVQNLVSPTPYVSPSKKDYEILFQPLFDEYFNPPPHVVSLVLAAVAAPRAVDLAGSPLLTIIDQDVPSASTSPTIQEIRSQVTHQDTMADMNIPANDAPAEKAPAHFSDTMCFNSSTGLYSCQLDEQWFNLHKDILRDALDIATTNDNNPYVALPLSDTVIKYVNILGYLSILKNVSAMSVNALYQPWRAILSMINICLTGKTAGYDRPRHPGIIGMPIPDALLTDEIKGAPYYGKYQEQVAKYQQYLDAEHGKAEEGGETESPKATKVTKPKEAKATKPAGDKAPKLNSTQPPKPKPAPNQPSKAVLEKTKTC
uniref:Integrase, catalytic region, zinc finger, CCHC-type, peptidase aspartic, catalytic n=1 Tax=Tanacetum cinerariifolium TaxID=118510 RepID=A0A6L2J5K8_TANCI|nr:hypothetical protein [Tanacetum cinerariifolium]